MREAAGLHFRSGNQRVKKPVVLSDPETGKKELGIELGEQITLSRESSKTLTGLRSQQSEPVNTDLLTLDNALINVSEDDGDTAKKSWGSMLPIHQLFEERFSSFLTYSHKIVKAS
ncbi:unnamed protein product [Dovyalis caffra]|uniref:Uncharacterized protein n=1 Tax=Dovyalis caffra TaxID=77055 RepID=A0AAV1QVS0_9ROSI|nr:unnamed protein product [Dovyalis caffra]